jgi:hypothetical protein
VFLRSFRSIAWQAETDLDLESFSDLPSDSPEVKGSNSTALNLLEVKLSGELHAARRVGAGYRSEITVA